MGGHEGVGKVVKLGAGAENSSVKVGDRVGIKWVSGTCGSCREFPCLLSPLFFVFAPCKMQGLLGERMCWLTMGWFGCF